ncbi:MAG: metallophosphoesterase [Clostridiales bacterium]|nr:metallophosphoesterase [Clostridiales bacterium]
MNRRPNQSRSGYDSFSPKNTARFKAATPGNDFFDVRRKKPLGLRLALYFFLFFLAVLAVNFAVNQFVHVRRVTVPITGLSEDFDGYTLLHISDLKGKSFGGSQRLFSFALDQTEFDAVVITGDMISALGNAQPFYALIDQLSALNPAAPIYFIAGDSDPPVTSESYFTGGSPFASWVLSAQQRGAHLLSAPVSIERGNQSLWLTTGSHLNLDLDTMQDQFELQYLSALSSGDENAIELAAYNLSWLGETRTARKTMTGSDAVITLMHAPPTQDDLLNQADLVLCGHSLGGVMRLPFLGPVFMPSSSLPRYGLFPGRDVHYGLSRQGRTHVYVSPGLGSAGHEYPSFFFRLFNPPTVTLITLTPSSI